MKWEKKDPHGVTSRHNNKMTFDHFWSTIFIWLKQSYTLTSEGLLNHRYPKGMRSNLMLFCFPLFFPHLQLEWPGLGDFFSLHAVHQDFHTYFLPAGVYSPPALFPRALPPAHRPPGCSGQRGEHDLQVRQLLFVLFFSKPKWEFFSSRCLKLVLIFLFLS